MKKILTLLLALLVALSLCACGAANDEPAEDQTDDGTQATEPVDAQAPAESDDADTQSADGDTATQPAVDPKPVVDETPTQTGTTTTQPAQQPVQQPAQQPAQSEPAPAAPTASDAAAYIGRSTSSLAAAIGQPSSKSYASSCLGEGEDGEWYYNGFTVYTYRDTSGAETVQDVM